MMLTRRSSRLPRGAASLGFDSGFLGSWGFGAGSFGAGGSFAGGLGLLSWGWGSDFFSGGGRADSCCVSASSFLGSGSEDDGWSSGAGALGSWPAFCLSPPFGGPPSSNFRRSCPTVTVSSSLARNSLIVPASGALTATSI